MFAARGRLEYSASSLMRAIGRKCFAIGSCVLPFVLMGVIACERLPEGTLEAPSKVLVEVNGETLTQREFDLLLPEDYEEVLTGAEKREYVDRWITTQLLYGEVRRSGMSIAADVDVRVRQYRRDLIADQLVQKIIRERATVSEDEVKAYYNAHANEYLTEYRVSHILVNTLDDAEKVKALIGKNSFTYLARRYSIDKHSGAGGDLGYLQRGNMIPEVEDVVFGMNVGEVSDIIESEFGYHIITVTDIRDARFKISYEDAREEITNLLMLEKRESVYDDLIATLRQRADIYIDEASLGFTNSTDDSTSANTE